MRSFLLIGLLFLAGCGDTPQEIQSKLDSPQIMGKVDGRELKRVVLSVGGSTEVVYFFNDNSQPVTTNYRVGKHTAETITINGQSYKKIE